MKKKVALIIPAIVISSFAADYLFPSSNPPGGKTPDQVEQFASIIWDDNAYSGKAGTNYEGPSTVKFQFGTNNWVNNLRSEGGWITTKNKNELNLTEGMIGMSWAAHTLAGEKVYPYKLWENFAKYEPIGYASDTVIYNDSIWACKDWAISQGTKVVTSKTAEGKDTTVTVNEYHPPRFMDTTGTFTISAQEIDPATGQWITVEKTVTWSELQAWDKAALKEQYKAWEYVGVVDKTLERKNADGTPIRFTFNVISGLMVPTFPIDWQARESKFGFYVPNEEFYEVGYNQANKHAKIAVSWGREMPIYTNSSLAEEFTTGYITQAFDAAYETGHEIGNHTIDHMESNSPLPVDYYEQWNADRATNGFDYSVLDTMPWGTIYNEAVEFGQRDGNIWQTMGWKMYAGKYISKETWKGAIELSEDQLDEYLQVSRAHGNLGAFRAPRLEVNSNLYFALSELNYQYDCGLEDGYEQNIDGTNFLWPYTLDNGNPNATYQRVIGEDVAIDSMPAGLWQIPSNVFVVPERIRDEVYANHVLINAAAADGEEIESLEDWSNGGGKITGYDFNLYILWGMEKAHWVETMKHNITLRMNGNKAPLHYGAHTDYYTPIYDYATLLNDQNKDSYGLSVTNKWNTWQDRITSMEEWIDWSVAQGVNFVTGKRLIEEINTMKSSEVIGGAGLVPNLQWNFDNNPDLGSTAEGTSFTGDFSTNVTVKAATAGAYPNPRFNFYESAGYFDGLTHVQLKYKTTAPIALRIVMNDGSAREVILGSIGNQVNSGLVPLSSFSNNMFDAPVPYTPITTSNIVGIELKVLTSGKAESVETVSISDLVLYGASGTVPTSISGGIDMKKGNITVQNMTHNNLSLSIPTAGNYSVSILGLNGRVMNRIENRQFSAGVTSLGLDGLSTGVYLIKVEGMTDNIVLKSFVN